MYVLHNLVYIVEQSYQRILKTKHLLANLNKICHSKRSLKEGWERHRENLFSFEMLLGQLLLRKEALKMIKESKCHLACFKL